MYKKFLAGLALMFALTVMPSFADYGDQPTVIQMNNGVVRTMSLDRAVRMQNRGWGRIVGPAAQYNSVPSNVYAYPRGYYNPNNSYRYSNPYYYYVPDTSGAGHPHQHVNDGWGW